MCFYIMFFKCAQLNIVIQSLQLVIITCLTILKSRKQS